MEAFIWIAVGVYLSMSILFFAIARNSGWGWRDSLTFGSLWPLVVYGMLRT